MKKMRNVLHSMQLFVFLAPFALAAGATVFAIFYLIFG